MALNAGDIPVAYDHRGSGEPPLLLLPGWCTGRSVFDDLSALMADHHRSLAMDWRGHGESGPATGDLGTPARSHSPTIEAPDQVADVIEQFV